MEAAKMLGCTPVALKQACKNHGIDRWPFRKVQAGKVDLQDLKAGNFASLNQDDESRKRKKKKKDCSGKNTSSSGGADGVDSSLDGSDLVGMSQMTGALSSPAYYPPGQMMPGASMGMGRMMVDSQGMPMSRMMGGAE
eukprot:CAMPEP_0182900758 /NCGR_PEP_ID=MMETSP0034_2-20130328/29098_1 /TAXON_ID=156128 /ORGANISM="Nephroselmis pyriformis, Strain CCMP717" /LENGTH=137 /DNA_ID=CAMNT_0025035027 /DNA_START=75 /DNA_END=485 /DNA_ORIENTATION=+